jgi:hypothetical protein
MLRRLATLALSLSLATTAFTSTATARAFAQPPGAAPSHGISADEVTRPRISKEARTRLRKVLAAHRRKNIDAFAGYARRGVFPHNFDTSGALNVWIDEEGHRCAAATMIFRSGARKLVRDIGRTNNNIMLGRVSTGPVMDWILTSGLTQAEVAAIQEPFMGRPDLPADPEPGSPDWRTAEDFRLKARYAEVLEDLNTDPYVSIDAAIDALATRPDLVARLLQQR